MAGRINCESNALSKAPLAKLMGRIEGPRVRCKSVTDFPVRRCASSRLLIPSSALSKARKGRIEWAEP